MNVIKRFALNLLIVIDETANALIGGSPNETISERAAKARADGRPWGCLLCRFLDWVQKDHCSNALTSTIGDDAIIRDGK